MGWCSAVGGAGMKDAKQAAPDVAEERRKAAKASVVAIQASLASMESALETHNRQMQDFAAYHATDKSFDADQRELHADWIRRLHEWLNGRAVVISRTRDAIGAVRRELAVVSEKIATQQTTTPTPPWIGELIICLFVQPDRQADRIADFAEQYRTLWLPKFPRLAGALYIAHVLWSGADVAKITTVAAVMDFVSQLLGR